MNPYGKEGPNAAHAIWRDGAGCLWHKRGQSRFAHEEHVEDVALPAEYTAEPAEAGLAESLQRIRALERKVVSFGKENEKLKGSMGGMTSKRME